MGFGGGVIALVVVTTAHAATVAARFEPAHLALGDRGTLVVEADGQTDRAPTIPPVPGLEIELRSRRVRATPGPVTRWTYQVTPRALGRFDLPAIAVAGGVATGLSLDVREGRQCESGHLAPPRAAVSKAGFTPGGRPEAAGPPADASRGIRQVWRRALEVEGGGLTLSALATLLWVLWDRERSATGA